MSDNGYHQARIMMADDIQLVQFHCNVPTNIPTVLRHPCEVHEGAEHVFTPCKLFAISTMEACLCSNIVRCHDSDLLCCN